MKVLLRLLAGYICGGTLHLWTRQYSAESPPLAWGFQPSKVHRVALEQQYIARHQQYTYHKHGNSNLKSARWDDTADLREGRHVGLPSCKHLFPSRVVMKVFFSDQPMLPLVGLRVSPA